MKRHADPAARLQAILEVDIDFAAEQSDMFWLVYGPTIVERERFPELIDASKRSYGILQACVFDFPRANDLERGCTQEVVQCAGSAVHGMAMLFNGRPWGPSIPTAMSFRKWRSAIVAFTTTGLLARAAVV